MSLLDVAKPCFKSGKPSEDKDLSDEDLKEYKIQMTIQRFYDLIFKTKKWKIKGRLSGNEHYGPMGDNHAWANRRSVASAETEISWKNEKDEIASKQHEIVCCNMYSTTISDDGTVIDTGGNDDGNGSPSSSPVPQGSPSLSIDSGYYDKKTGIVYPHIYLSWSISTSVGGRRDGGKVPKAFNGAISGSVDGIALPMWCTWGPSWEKLPGWTWSGSISVVATREVF
jgi:hypothetical protein